jgi:hypothetical protein
MTIYLKKQHGSIAAGVKWNRAPAPDKWTVLDTGCLWTQLFLITLVPFKST